MTASPPPRLPWAIAGLTLAVVAGTLAVGWLDPPRYRALLQEDGWGEWATFITFVLAAYVALRATRRLKDRAQQAVLVALSAFCIFVAGEEISWGQRLLGFTPPDVFLEHNYQQESNLHNLLKRVLDTRWMVLMIAAGYGVLLPLVMWFWRRRTQEMGPGRRSQQRTPEAFMWIWLRRAAPSALLMPGFAAVALLEAFYPLTLSGELAELALGLCFLADASLRADHDLRQAERRATGLSVGALACAALVPVGIDAWTRAHAHEATAQARREIEQLADDLRSPGVVQASLRPMRRVHKRIFTAIRADYLQFGEASRFLEGVPSPAEAPDSPKARRDQRGYFMDPWLQPYWVCYVRVSSHHGRLFLYSFGANRRRDTPIRALRTAREATALLRGDDVGVTLEVEWPH